MSCHKNVSMVVVWYGMVPYHTTILYGTGTTPKSRQLPYLPDYFHNLSPLLLWLHLPPRAVRTNNKRP